ncbi:hypothetical protein C8Q80DRAFT_870678 [Daedaleopsis nitida]|nr:hypothetical protein C8Q80DRAFT_870678 [Daedaleopsis nitida]
MVLQPRQHTSIAKTIAIGRTAASERNDRARRWAHVLDPRVPAFTSCQTQAVDCGLLAAPTMPRRAPIVVCSLISSDRAAIGTHRASLGHRLAFERISQDRRTLAGMAQRFSAAEPRRTAIKFRDGLVIPLENPHGRLPITDCWCRHTVRNAVVPWAQSRLLECNHGLFGCLFAHIFSVFPSLMASSRHGREHLSYSGKVTD